MNRNDFPDPSLKNHILKDLPSDEFNRIKPSIKIVHLELGKVLYESGDRLNYAYFPTTAIISLLYVMENGATAEIGVIGNEGFMGVPLVLGGQTTTNRAVIQSAGDAVRIEAGDLQSLFKKEPVFNSLLLRSTQALLTQISQTAVCNRLHSLEQQLCRWLLLSHDRLDSDKLVMTHDLISNMLGVRREGITTAAIKLVKRGLIKNDRGAITVLDRAGLEDTVCECYRVVSIEYDRLMGRGIARTFA